MRPEAIPKYNRVDNNDEEELGLLPSDLQSVPPAATYMSKDAELESQIESASTYMSKDSSSLPPTAIYMTKDQSLKGSFSFWGIGDRKETKTETETETETETITKSSSPWTIIKSNLTNKSYLIHYFIVSISAGIGQMYIYTVGFIVTAQFYYGQPQDEHTRHDPKVSSSQALQVSIISVSSFLGRLIAGFLSDYLHKRFQIQRITIVLFTLVLLNIGQGIIITNVSSQILVSIASAFMGSSYGLIFGTYPAIIADEFGSKSFSTNWGLICTGPLFTLYILNKYFGLIYDDKINKDTGVCYLGNLCYKGAFELSFAVCCLAFLVTAVLIYKRRK
ncbi:unnamed protein product [Candida verbasci]|uniref:Major facilitator superfamily (MFS) profile domain-containing protein n=1 Tax=Candida verbasci TaxID=1227364 RepID=A0A9W4TYN8_9ASCO|nr:unnamed protein product [Candida verbasci]